LIKEAYLRAGGWPGLIFLLLHHLELLAAWPAAALAVGFGLIHLAAARWAGRTGGLNWSLVVYLGLILIGLSLGAGWADLLLSRYFFFGLYSALFLTLAARLWFSLGLFGSAPARPSLEEASSSRIAAWWAGLWLASALLAMGSGPLLQVVLPGLLLAGSWVLLRRRTGRDLPPLGPGVHLIGPEEIRSGGQVVSASPGGAAVAKLTRRRLDKLIDGPEPNGPAGPEAGAEEPDLEPDQEASRPVQSSLGPVKEALVIQGSPRGRAGTTEMLLRPFLDGLESQQVQVRVAYLAELNIQPCQGEFDCWVRSPGHCRLRDDMDALLRLVREADLVVLAQPVYFGSVPGLTKTFLDRCLPLLEPWLVAGPGGGSARSARQGALLGQRLALLAVGSLADEADFQPLAALARYLARLGQAPLVASLIRPTGELLYLGPRLGRRYQNLLRALYEAGVELARQGRVPAALEAAVKAPLYDSEAAFRLVANLFWETWRDYGAAKRAGLELPAFEVYLSQDIRLALGTMVLTFDPAAAPRQALTVQLNCHGRQPGQWYLSLEAGRCSFHEGWAAESDLIVHTPSETWVSVARGELEAEEAVASGLIRQEGPGELLAWLGRAFGWPGGGERA